MNDPENLKSPEPKQVELRQEKEISLKAVLLIAASLLVSIGVVMGAAALLVALFTPGELQTRDPNEMFDGDIEGVPSAPRLQANPVQDMVELRAQQEQLLNSYGWVNQDDGQARIPIARAMQLLVENGLPYEDRMTPADEGRVEANDSGISRPDLDLNRPGLSSEAPLIDPFGFDESLAELFARPPEDSPPSVEDASPEEGQQIFQQLGCGGCHTEQEGAVGPPLVGLFGTQEQLESGETVVVDESYLYEAIVNPNAQIVAGYAPIMPGYADRATPEQIAAIIAYIKSLGE